MSFGDSEYAGKKKRTRREVFLAEMNKVVPWKALLALIEPAYPKAGRGRPPYALETMLRIHLMQNWFGFSDPAMEDALYEIAPVRQFAQLSLTRSIPDETTILNGRHLLEANDLAPKILQCVNGHLCDRGMLLKRRTIVDATIGVVGSLVADASLFISVQRYSQLTCEDIRPISAANRANSYPRCRIAGRDVAHLLIFPY